MAVSRKLSVDHESWPIAGSFSISRGTKTTAEVIKVTLEQDGATGVGESVPYARYNETIDAAMDALNGARAQIEAGCSRADVHRVLNLHAAQNALDCALWDLEAKLTGTPVWQLAGLDKEPEPVITAYTLSLETPEKMAEAAARASGRPLLKIKLGGDGDHERLRAIRDAAPDTRLIIDANEAWKPADLDNHLAACAETAVELVEQPLPAGDDDALGGLGKTDVLICADESAHGKEDLHKLAGKYSAINVKLDKTGGLTEALALADAAQDQGFEIMIGCMLATSLAMAPGHIVAQRARVVDLDGPLLLARDRDPGIRFDGSLMYPPPPALWG
ncbi:N-acetyl-D-Glu racemase DgcA [Anderseniella sp. Alg231-50]|uniref:N-acetyl-D-Glu racemase DgcA n=1 Tax=Anderseniella sp. Alg231-50 TaxID=1922226 RepID=UPI000D55A546